MPIKGIHPPWMFSPFVAFIQEIMVNLFWLYSQEFVEKASLNVKVKTDFLQTSIN